MSFFIRSFLKKQNPVALRNPERDPVRYELEKEASISPDTARRLKIARSRKTHQEILYYMAQNDADAGVRKAVAKNLATPLAACGVIARDPNVDVRLALAGRLVKMLPDLSQDDYSHLYAIAVKALGALAMDETLRVRVSLARALKDKPYAPPDVMAQLARDVEREVAEPVLRFCMVLPDDILLGILQATPLAWKIEAIANRKNVSESVSRAVVETSSKSGGISLLKNKHAKIDRAALNNIVTKARELPEWQEPLALLEGLPPEIAVVLSEFAQDTVQKILMRRRDLDRKTRETIAQVVKRRLVDPVAISTAKELEAETPYQRAANLMRQSKLDEALISDSIVTREYDFVIAALACLAKTTPEEVKRVMALNTAKPITALTWKAGLSMRLALQLQQTIGRVQPRELLYPRNGTEYPMDQKELDWQIEFLGLKAG